MVNGMNNSVIIVAMTREDFGGCGSLAGLEIPWMASGLKGGMT